MLAIVASYAVLPSCRVVLLLVQRLIIQSLKGQWQKMLFTISHAYTSKGSPLYWSPDSRAEIEFVIQWNDEIIPIEVKAENCVSGRSLSVYKENMLLSIVSGSLSLIYNTIVEC